MKVVGRVESLWRYPVKSMRGEELHQAFAGFAGIYGDRFYAFVSSAAPKGFPYFTGREQGKMLLCRPEYRHAEQMANPPNLAEAEAISPGLTLVYPAAADLMVDVRTPSGELLPIDDPLLIKFLREGLRDIHELRLLRSDRAITDCRPISLFAVHTAEQLSQEVGAYVDKRRFRANVYVELASKSGFGENEFVGRTLRIGVRTVVAVLKRDHRCKMITLDPDTAEANPDVMRQVARAHDGQAGVYAAVLVEGTICSGDEIALLD